MPATFRFADKPMASSSLILPTLRDGEWLGEMKLDGWRCLLVRDDAGDWTYTTRHRKPCPVGRALAADLARQLAHLPAGTMLDGEWLCRRAGHGTGSPERIVLFDVLRLGDEWQTQRGALARFEVLQANVPADLIVRHATAGYAAFFEQSKLDPLTEGIVLKHVDSPYLASMRECRINPNWHKVKYRDGSDGQTLVA